jgi:hypothetical protein
MEVGAKSTLFNNTAVAPASVIGTMEIKPSLMAIKVFK